MFDYLADREQLTENEAAGIIKQVLETLDYMHNLKIAHFDLKPENIMLWAQNYIILAHPSSTISSQVKVFTRKSSSWFGTCNQTD